MDNKQKEELRTFITEKGYNLYSDQMTAKENLDDLCKGWKDTTGISKADILKMIKVYYDDTKLQEEKLKLFAFEELFKDVMEDK